MSRRPLDIFYVTYEEDDLMGMFMALATVIPYFILCYQIVHIAVLIFSHKNKEADWIWKESTNSLILWLFTVSSGQIVNELLSNYIKNTLRIERPPMSHDEFLYRGIITGHIYGMPSSHAQFMGYWATIMISRLTRKSNVRNLRYYLFASAFLVALFVVSFSRYYLQYHDVFQIITGLAAGYCFALLWDRLTSIIICRMYI